MTSLPPRVPKVFDTCLSPLKALESDYSWSGFIAKGAYGHVYAGVHKGNKTKVAAKVMPAAAKGMLCPHAVRDLRASLAATHPGLLQPKRVGITSSGALITIMSRYDDNLYNFYRSRRLSMDQIRHIFLKLAQGLVVLHAKGFIHRDIKPLNVLLQSDLSDVRLGDWSLSRDQSVFRAGSLTPYVVSAFYAPPEVLAKQDNYTTAVDVWSLGIMLAEILCGKLPFSFTTRTSYIFNLLEVLGTPAPHSADGQFFKDTCGIDLMAITRLPSSLQKRGRADVPVEAWDLVNKMLRYSPDSRCTMVQVTNHPFLAGFGKLSVHSVTPKREDRIETFTNYCRIKSDKLLTVFEPHPLRVEPAVAGWQTAYFSTEMLVQAWSELKSFKQAPEAWMLCMCMSQSLLQPLEKSMTARQMLGTMFTLAARSIGDSGTSVSHMQATRLDMCVVDDYKIALRRETLLLAKLKGGVPHGPSWLSQLRDHPDAMEMACFAVCFGTRVSSLSIPRFLNACKAYEEGVPDPTLFIFLKWADEFKYVLTRIKRAPS